MPSLKGKHTLALAESTANKVVEALKPYCNYICICGSIRRKRVIVGDIDIIVAETHAGFEQKLYDMGCSIGNSSAKFAFLYDGIAVDVLVVDAAGWGAAMMHSTGPVGENIRLRALAMYRGYMLNQYGLYSSGGIRIAGRTEEEVYAKLGVKYVPPTERDASSSYLKY